MFTVTRILTIKPGTAVDRTKFEKTPEQKQYIKTKYTETKKLLKEEFAASKDGLTVTATLYWKSHEDYFDFLLDEQCTDLIKENNIFKSLSKEEKENTNLTIKAEIINE
jgi:hypothetical protein